MNHFTPIRWIFGSLTVFALAGWTQSQEAPPPKPDAPPDSIEILTRGPIHEAFAAPVSQQPIAPTPIRQEPPPPIAEDPPQERPDIDNAQWIPGYWAWDAERQGFMWVSGVYRVAPQGRTFVPGYWENTAQGYRWVAGFWSNGNQKELAYLPEPPAPMASDPGQPPNADSVYIPGAWVYSNDRFIWRAGYWSAAQAGRMWMPSQYVWTPNGYIFVDGYWDQPYDARGLAYAPVYFNQPLWNNPNWRYQPSYLLNSGAFFNSAFVRGNSFYFGNYYNPLYARLGFSPWYAGSGRYDPVFAHYGWQNHRNNPNWINGVQQQYANRTGGHGTLPPASLAQQRALVQANKGAAVVSTPAQFHSNNFRLAQTTPTQLNAQRTQSQQTRQLAASRQQAESAAAKHVSAGPHTQVLTFQNNAAHVKTNHTASHANQTFATPRANATAALPRITQQQPAIRAQTPTHTNTPQILNNHPASQPRNMSNTPHIQHSAPTHAPRVQTSAPHVMHSAPVHHAAPQMMRSAPVHHAAPSGGHGGGHGGGHRR